MRSEWRNTPELASAARLIEDAGWDPVTCARRLTAIDGLAKHLEPIIGLKQQLERKTAPFKNAAFERAFLLLGAEQAWPTIATTPVHPRVLALLLEDLRGFANDKKDRNPILGTPMFVASAKLATGRRFPAGAMDWEISGISRSWLLKAGVVGALRLGLMVMHVGGFQPFLFMHVALRPRNRALIIEKEVMRSYYRMASSLNAWPQARGIVAHAWFHDPVAVKENPHLEFLNRPYVTGGGARFRLNLADETSGFAENNPDRMRRFEIGQLNYRMYAAVWPRDAALSWVAQHPEYNQ